MSNNTTMKYACEQFDGKTNFGIWQSTVKDILVQQGLLKPLLGNKPESMDQDDWEELQAKAVSTIRGRSRSRNSGHGKDRSKSRGKQDKSSIECWYCKEIGHIARRCPERKEKQNRKKHVNKANVAEEDDKSSDGDLYLVSSVEQQEGGVMKVSKGAMVIMKGQKTGNLYKLMGNTVIGGASVSTHVGSSNDNSELWHKRLGHLSEGGMLELHKRKLLQGVKSCKLDFYKFCVFGKQKRYTDAAIKIQRDSMHLKMKVHRGHNGGRPDLLESAKQGIRYHPHILTETTMAKRSLNDLTSNLTRLVREDLPLD
ncbi:hypothetical protein RJ640_027672 [Escallonia rubra]|uniref:CCHC-type domain-containing protein n=1 Tax=Escallonia rubra TaxID=112253 RepID=A0AA88UQL3_9ASTE|nr:hypothetical protein RJ640_027672 [Escallonia rubra]